MLLHSDEENGVDVDVDVDVDGCGRGRGVLTGVQNGGNLRRWEPVPVKLVYL